MTKARINLSIDTAVLAEARDSKLNLSRFVEEKLAEHAREMRAAQWLAENRDAIRAYNERVERDGLWNEDLISF